MGTNRQLFEQISIFDDDFYDHFSMSAPFYGTDFSQKVRLVIRYLQMTCQASFEYVPGFENVPEEPNKGWFPFFFFKKDNQDRKEIALILQPSNNAKIPVAMMKYIRKITSADKVSGSVTQISIFFFGNYEFGILKANSSIRFISSSDLEKGDPVDAAIYLKRALAVKKYPKERFDQIGALLKCRLQDSPFILALGAGVSNGLLPGSKAGSWKELLTAIRPSTTRADPASRYLGTDYLVAAQRAKNKGKTSYFNKLFRAIYPARSKSSFHLALGTTMRSLVTLIKANEHLADSPIKGAITYNYDAFLEESLLRSLGSTSDWKSVSVYSQKIASKHFILHANGSIPWLPRSKDFSQAMKKSVILAEDDYNAVFEHPSGWSSCSQYFLFDSFNCLFVGLSLKDSGLRRILFETRQDIFKVRVAIIPFINPKRPPDASTRCEVEKYFSAFGILVWWAPTPALVSSMIDSLI